MRRLTTCFNALLLGMILGMIFVAIVHALPSHRQEQIRASGITIGYRILGAKNHKSVLPIPEATIQLFHLPPDFCAYLVNQCCHASSSVIARPACLDKPAKYQKARAFRKQGALLPFDR
jgi:hypothetical protein